MGFFFKDLFAPSKSRAKKIYGDKPEYGTTEDAAAEATRANLANLPEAQKLAGQVNTFNAGEMSRLLEMTQPGFAGRQKEIGNIYDARLKGKFTESELNELQLANAATGIESGTSGSPFNRERLARQLGLHQWEETQKSIDSFSRWTQSIAQLTQPATFNVGSAFVPFETQLGWNKLQAENLAAPDPAVRGSFDSQMAFASMAWSVWSGGGPGYQNAYKSNQQQGGSYPQYNNMSNPNIYPQFNTVSGNMGESSPGYGSSGPYE
jgi:hypothetical protein